MDQPPPAAQALSELRIAAGSIGAAQLPARLHYAALVGEGAGSERQARQLRQPPPGQNDSYVAMCIAVKGAARLAAAGKGACSCNGSSEARQLAGRRAARFLHCDDAIGLACMPQRKSPPNPHPKPTAGALSHSCRRALRHP